MAKRIQGITIELDGDSKPLKKALQDVDKASSNTTKELGQINRALKFDEGNTTLLSQKFDVLQDAISNTSTRLETLKKAQADVDRQFKAGKIDASTYREFQREIEITEGKLQSFKKQADNVKSKVDVQVDASGIDKAESKLKDLGSTAKQVGKEIGDNIAMGAAAATAAIGGIAIAGQEAARDLARMDATIQNLGFDNTEGQFDTILAEATAVTGEMDSAVEAINNLANTNMDQSQLEKTMQHLSGAAVQFSDTLKLEGLADGLQETLATGKAIGQFGEYLERSGMDLEVFNEGLEKAQKNGSEMDYVLQILSNAGAKDFLDSYKDMNGALYENQKAQAELEIQTAEFSKTLAPLMTVITNTVSSLIGWMNANPQVAQTITIIVGAIAGLSGALAVLGPIISGISAAMPVLGGLFAALTGPIGLVVAAIAALIAIFVLFKDDIIAMWNEHLQPVFDQLVATITETLQPTFESAFTMISEIVKGAFDIIQQAWDSVLHPAFETIMQVIQTNLAPAFETGFKTIVDIVGTVFETITSLWNTVLHPVIKIIIEIIKYTLLPAFQVAFGAISSVVSTTFKAISDFWTGTLKPVLTGITDFVSGVFSGNWEKAWSGVVTTFSGIFNGVSTAVKTPLNAVIGMINAVIDGMNSLSIDIPDWVPGFGGQEWGISIPRIPMLAKGTNYFKGGLAIVGEKGPELVQMPTGSKVYPNDKTKQMLGAQQGPQIIVVQSVLDGRVIGESV
ncbi:hypothetical protein D7X33_25930, partial [Butyricicoccus sp. 1XD8-22]